MAGLSEAPPSSLTAPTGAVHETGHALYEQGRNLSAEWKDLPVNSALSMGVHESQSLLWERMVALSQPFCKYINGKVRARAARGRWPAARSDGGARQLQLRPPAPTAPAVPSLGRARRPPTPSRQIHKHFPDFPKRSADELWGAINVIKDPSFIRVESDEARGGGVGVGWGVGLGGARRGAARRHPSPRQSGWHAPALLRAAPRRPLRRPARRTDVGPPCPAVPSPCQVTYGMHIVLRYEIERALIRGDLKVKDVSWGRPGAGAGGRGGRKESGRAPATSRTRAHDLALQGGPRRPSRPTLSRAGI
jgi:hypothetical protein